MFDVVPASQSVFGSGLPAGKLIPRYRLLVLGQPGPRMIRANLLEPLLELPPIHDRVFSATDATLASAGLRRAAAWYSGQGWDPRGYNGGEWRASLHQPDAARIWAAEPNS